MTPANQVNSAIAIVGMDCVFPCAPDLQTFWENICRGVDAIGDVPAGRVDSVFFEEGSSSVDRLYTRRGGFIDDYAQFDPASYGIMPVAVSGAEPDQLLTLEVAFRALDDAGYLDRPFPRDRTSIILGRGNYLGAGMVRLANQIRGAEQLVTSLRTLLPDVSEGKIQEIKADFQARAGSITPDTAIGLVPNLVASRIANRLDLGGSAYTVDAACSSALLSVDQACSELRGYQSDLVIAGGVHLCHDPPFWSVLCMLGAVSREQEIRPFDRRADGMLIGEGIGIMVLKRLEDAGRDGDRVYAVIRGSGVSSDGRDASIMAPAVSGQLLALERAWAQSALDKEAIGLIEAHGTGTRSGDAAELETLARFFGPPAPDRERAGLGTVKSMIGHTMPAAGAAGMIKAAMAVYHGILPPTLHCEEPQDLLEETRFKIISRPEPWQQTTRVAGVNAFGFGGINCHVILESPPHPETPHGTPPALPAPAIDVLFLEADSQEALLAAAESGRPAAKGGSWRLAVVNPTPERLEAAKDAVTAGKPRFGRDGLYFSPQGLVSRGGKIAFLFPGVEARTEPKISRLAAFLNLAEPDLGEDDLTSRGSDVFAVSSLYDRALREIGVRPDAIAGHSIGEWTGMVASGMLDTEAALTFAADLKPDDLAVADVAYLAAGAGADRVLELLRGVSGVRLSHDNCEHQSVLCGPPAEIEEALQILRSAQIIAEVLPFRSGFHSPALEPHIGHYTELLRELELRTPSVPLWSATTCAPYPGQPEAIQALFGRHLVEPVRFRSLTQRLWEEGVRVFVQVGAGSLSAFIDDSLTGAEHHALNTAVAQRDGLEQLYWVAAALFAEGVDLDLARLGFAKPKPKKKMGMPIQLGVPLIQLGVPPLQISANCPTEPPAESSVTGEFSKTRDALEGGRQTLSAALEGSKVATPAALDALPPSAPPGRRSSEKILLSCEAYPELQDHCMFPQPKDWPVLADRAPSVPITMSLSLMVEAAEKLVPGRVAVAVENVVANAWMLVEPPLEAEIVSEEIEPGRVRVKIAANISGDVVLAPAYPERPAPSAPMLKNQRPATLRQEAIYRDRWMFHGPAYHAVSGLGEMGDDGMRGELTALPARGALLDAAGQLASLWILMNVRSDKLAMPVKVRRVEIFGPELRGYERAQCHLVVKSLGQREVQSDIEVVLDGLVYYRITDWQDWRFDTGGGLFSVMRFPERNLLAEVQPGGYTLIRDSDRPLSTMEFLAGRFLTAIEIAEVKQLPGRRRQGDWLYGRIAAKDAVRAHLFERGYRSFYPVEITVRSDPSGKPLVSGPFSEDIRVSIAHADKVAVALAAENADPGIDVELIEPRSDQFADLSFTADELSLLPGADRDEWLTRFWCAKEAAGKARGTGLAGSPKTLKVTSLDGQRLLVDDRWVRTQRVDTHIVAWTE